jgi:hypothetical protein
MAKIGKWEVKFIQTVSIVWLSRWINGGSMPPAVQFSEIVTNGISIYGYSSPGGSVFTTDKDVGHFRKAFHGRKKDIVTKDENAVEKIRAGQSVPLWLVTNSSTDAGMNHWNGFFRTLIG